MHMGTLAHAALDRSRFRAAAGALALLLAAACTDRMPVGADLRPRAGAEPAAALACRADVRAGTVECAPPAPSTPGSAAILGGQGLNVRLRSSGLAYDGSILRIDVTVENLMGQALGTRDDRTPTTEGVRVFFTDGPTSATGAVEVDNPTGETFFTAAGQKYFQYDGMLAMGDTTAPREWRFAMGPEVQSFQFTVLVSAAVPREGGWLRVSPVLPSMAVGSSMPFSVERLDVAGRLAATGPITWTSANATIAYVAADGRVTGVAPGKTRIFASDGSRTSSVEVLVRGAARDLVPPTVYSVTVSPARVVANGVDSVHVAVRVADAASGTRDVFVQLRGPAGVHGFSCRIDVPSAGNTYICSGLIPAHAEGGDWRVTTVETYDEVGNGRAMEWTGLRDAGAAAHVYVRSDTPDVEPPDITSVTFTPDSVEANGLDSITVSVQVADAGTGVVMMYASFASPGSNILDCEARAPSAGTVAAGTFTCRLAIPLGEESGRWQLDIVRAYDAPGNEGEADLSRVASSFNLWVFTPGEDTSQPALTGFSFTPDTVAANGVDTVTVTMAMTYYTASAMEAAGAIFESPSGQSAGCYNHHPGPAVEFLTCQLVIESGQETGEWRVRTVWLEDARGHSNTYRTSDLEALGFPTVLTVTP